MSSKKSTTMYNDYKIRKTIENPTQKCFPFAQINISVTKFHQMIQKVKDLKQPVFAGYNIISHDADILTIDVLLSSPVLDPNTSEKDAEEYAYLHQLAESISRSELCISIKESALI